MADPRWRTVLYPSLIGNDVIVTSLLLLINGNYVLANFSVILIN